MTNDVASLPRLAPDPARAERTRTRCHDELRRRQHADDASLPRRRRPLVPIAIGGVCVLYAVAVVTAAVRMLRM